MWGHHCIPNFLLRTVRQDTLPQGERLLVFLGRELRTSVSLLRSKVEGKVMASEAKHKAARDAHTKFRVLPW